MNPNLGAASSFRDGHSYLLTYYTKYPGLMFTVHSFSLTSALTSERAGNLGSRTYPKHPGAHGAKTDVSTDTAREFSQGRRLVCSRLQVITQRRARRTPLGLGAFGCRTRRLTQATHKLLPGSRAL